MTALPEPICIRAPAAPTAERRPEPGALVMVMVDALRHDYVRPDTTPFLHSLASGGRIRALIPPLGFEPDATLFAGLEPAALRGGAQFTLAPATSPFWFVPRALGKRLDRLPSPMRLGLRLGTGWLAGALHRSRRVAAHATTARIPFALLRHFDFTQRHYPFEADFVPSGESLFDVARRRRIPFLFHGFPRDDVSCARVVAALKRRLRPAHGLVYLHIGDLDSVGHRSGPESDELRRTLAQVDDGVRAIVDHVHAVAGESQFVIFGDHGMCSVERPVDVAPALARLPLELERDYLYFLDSTLVRFWCADARVRERIAEVFDSVAGLERVEPPPTPPSARGEGGAGLGHLIYQAQGGCLVHPSFYADAQPPKGMHGYGPEVAGNHAAGIVWPAQALEREPLAAQWNAERVAMRGVHDVSRDVLERMRT